MFTFTVKFIAGEFATSSDNMQQQLVGGCLKDLPVFAMPAQRYMTVTKKKKSSDLNIVRLVQVDPNYTVEIILLLLLFNLSQSKQ